MTDQELFDECVSHVIEQGARAFTDGGCMYLTPDGLRCALGGPLFKRGLYKEGLEGIVPNGTYPEDTGAPLMAALDAWGIAKSQYALLKTIQKAHDNSDMHDFVGSFRLRAMIVAESYNLNTDVLA